MYSDGFLIMLFDYYTTSLTRLVARMMMMELCDNRFHCYFFDGTKLAITFVRNCVFDKV